jgi:hypothetical protein
MPRKHVAEVEAPAVAEADYITVSCGHYIWCPTQMVGISGPTPVKRDKWIANQLLNDIITEVK